MNFEEEESINILLNIFKSNFFKKVYMTLAFVGCVTTFICAKPLSRLECISLVMKLNFLYVMKLNKLIIVSIFVLSLTVYGCTTNSRNSDNIYHNINIESAFNNDVIVNLSEFVSDLQYIPIETKNDFLVSDIDKITVSNDYIYFCCKSSQQVYQIDSDGKFIRKVGQRGRAKNEYRAVTNLYSNPESIIVFFGRKILYFSAKTGEIEKVITPDNFADINHFTGFSQIGNGSSVILYTKEKENFLTVINSESVQINTKRLWDTEKRRVNMPMPNGKAQLIEWSYTSSLYNYDGETRVTKDFIDTIFTFSGSNLVPYAVFDYGNLEDNRFEPALNLETAFDGSQIQETKDFILFSTMMGEASYIYNKKTKETKRISKFENSTYQGFTNDIDNGIPFWPVAVTSDKMYSFMSADIFIEEAAKSNSEKMKQVAATITEESNPVIIVATLK